MTVAVVPMKPMREAKRRLRGALADEERERLAEMMLRDVLASLKASPSVRGIVVVSPDDAVAAIAGGPGVRFHREEGARGLDAAVSAAAEVLGGEGAASMLYVPGDVPLATPEEFEAIVSAAGNAPMVIVPSRDRDGTNAFLVSPPDLICPAFGPGSFDRHRSAAARAGIEAEVLILPGIAVDIDIPADLATLMEARKNDSRYGFLKDAVKEPLARSLT